MRSIAAPSGPPPRAARVCTSRAAASTLASAAAAVNTRSSRFRLSSEPMVFKQPTTSRAHTLSPARREASRGRISSSSMRRLGARPKRARLVLFSAPGVVDDELEAWVAAVARLDKGKSYSLDKILANEPIRPKTRLTCVQPRRLPVLSSIGKPFRPTAGRWQIGRIGNNGVLPGGSPRPSPKTERLRPPQPSTSPTCCFRRCMARG